VVCTDGALLSDEQFERLHLIQTEGGVTSAG
jgi:hypothetical protein